MNNVTQMNNFSSNTSTAPPLPMNNQTSDGKLLKEGPCNIKEPHLQTIDEDSAFWETYVREAGKYDAELLESWNESLSSLLLFAALFSAINTAFIIEIQRGLQPEPLDVTNDLIRKLINHSGGSEIIADMNSRYVPDESAVRLNAIFFASLSFSLIASFGAILGKEMLAEYKVSGVLNSFAKQGQIRQQKFDGLRKFHFRFLMHVLPVLLQISLALFLIGLIIFLVKMSKEVAMFMCIPVILGFIAYIVSLFTALRHIHSPFQTSVSKAIRLLFFSVQNLGSSVGTYTRELKTYFPPSQILGDIGQSQGQGFRSRGISIPKTLNRLFSNWRGLLPAFWRGCYHLKRVMMSRKRDTSEKWMKEDVVNAACITWLIEQAGDSQVQWQALAAVPLLPAEILRPLFSKRGIMHHCIFLYHSNLHRRSGQVKYRPDETQTKTAILAGTAIFHVLKSRGEDDDTHSDILAVDGDPDVFDIVENPDRIDELNFLLMTVIHCVQSQAGVDEWDVNLLLRLLQKCSTSTRSNMSNDSPVRTDEITLQLPSPTISTITPRAQAEVQSLSILEDASAVTLLLDSIVYCGSRRHSDRQDQSILSLCGDQFEQILDILPDIVESRKSMVLASHAAIVVSAIQWYKAANESAPEGRSIHGVTCKQIRSAWFSVDKSAQFLDNIILAFKLVGDNPSRATTKVYLSLMRLVERYHDTSMSVTWKNGPEWDRWWSKIIQIIPGVFRIYRFVSDDNRPDATQAALRIIAQLLPDDWMVKDLRDQRPVPQLRCIDPHNEEYGDVVTLLMRTFLNTPALQNCRFTRDAAAEVLGWMITLYQRQDRPELSSVISDPNGIYHQSTSVPSFLISVLKDKEADQTLRCFLQDQFDLLLDLPAATDGSISQVQLQAFVTSITSFADFPDSAKIMSTTRRFLNRIAEGLSEPIWPDSFVTAGIVARTLGTTNQRVLVLVQDDSKLLGGDDIPLLWMGTALVVAWKLFVRDGHNTAAGQSAIFCHDSILTVLDCFDKSVKTSHQISFSLFDDFLGSAQAISKIPDQLKERVESARKRLWESLNGDWDWLVLQRLGEDNAPT